MFPPCSSTAGHPPRPADALADHCPGSGTGGPAREVLALFFGVADPCLVLVGQLSVDTLPCVSRKRSRFLRHAFDLSLFVRNFTTLSEYWQRVNQAEAGCRRHDGRQIRGFTPRNAPGLK